LGIDSSNNKLKLAKDIEGMISDNSEVSTVNNDISLSHSHSFDKEPSSDKGIQTSFTFLSNSPKSCGEDIVLNNNQNSSSYSSNSSYSN
jgi:hypothetical protein